VKKVSLKTTTKIDYNDAVAVTSSGKLLHTLTAATVTHLSGETCGAGGGWSTDEAAADKACQQLGEVDRRDRSGAMQATVRPKSEF
jgi:hypothetical protein